MDSTERLFLDRYLVLLAFFHFYYSASIIVILDGYCYGL